MKATLLDPNGAGLKKYRSLIISLVILISLAIASILASLYLSSLYNKAFGRYTAMSIGIEMMHNLTIGVQAAADSRNSLEAREEYRKISLSNYQQARQFFPAFANGGPLTYGYGKLQRTVEVPEPLDAADDERAKSLHAKAIKILLDPSQPAFAKLASASTMDDPALDVLLRPEMQREVKNWVNGYTVFNSIRDDLLSRARYYDRMNKYVTLGSIAVLLTYFALLGARNLRRLIQADAAVAQAQRETQDIMANVNTGLFLLDKDLNIGQQYSSQLENIIGSKRIGGQNLTQLLENKVSNKDLETTKSFVKQLYNPRVKEKLVNDLNPLKKIVVHGDTHQNRYLDFKFSRVLHNGQIDKILVNVQDITQQVRLEQRLEQERGQNDLQIEMLTTILNVNPQVIAEFIRNTKLNVEKINDILKNPGSQKAELENKLLNIYRIMHSLKGEASALNLHSFTIIASNFEEKVKELQSKANLTGNDFLPLTIQLDELLTLSNTIDHLGQRINQKFVPTGSPEIAQSSSIDFDAFYQQFAQDIANRQGKQVILSASGFNAIQANAPLLQSIKDITLQLIRNAVVHGIEPEAARVAQGKSAQGHIELNLIDQPDHYMLRIRDDGQGIHQSVIRERALMMGYSNEQMNTWSQQQYIDLLFKSGFSTREHTDEDAGRGVGMDIVKSNVDAMKGDIKVISEPGQFTCFNIRIPK